MIELNISYAIKNLMKKMNLDVYSFSAILNVDIKSIHNYVDKHTNPTTTVIQKIIKIIEDNKFDVYQLFDLSPNDGYLFHGSKTGGIFGDVSTLKNLNEPNDFSNGFYLSDSLKNAINYVLDQNNPVIYRFRKEDVLKGKTYDFSNEKGGEIDWIIYIGLNRNKILNAEDKMFFKEYYDHKFKSYDVLTGEIADSYNFDVLNDFFNNLKDLEETKQALLLANIGPQFVMKNEKFANELKWVEVYKIETHLKNYLLSITREKKRILKNNRDIISQDHVFDKTTTFLEIKNKIKKLYEQRTN